MSETSIYICHNKIEESVCNRLISEAQSNFKPAGVYVNGSPQDGQLGRNNQVSWGKENWVYDLITPYVNEVMKNTGWDFELSSSEPYQVAKSKVGEYHYWHQDGVIGKNKNRKLSLSLILNDDYEGGELEVFPNIPLKEPRGAMIFFPSFQTHQVHSVTKGTRYSLVVWFSGKSWK